MPKVITVLLIIVGLINLLPLLGVLGSDRLSSLYGLDLTESNIAILMRHRALMFGIIGGFILYAAWVPSLQLPAFGAAFLSMSSFVLLAWVEGNANTEIRKVVMVDLVGLLILLVALVLYGLQNRVDQT